MFTPKRESNAYCSFSCYQKSPTKGNWKGGISKKTGVCEYCNKEFVARVYDVGKYCSAKCATSSRMQNIDVREHLHKINTGRKHTPEAIEKIRKASTGRKPSIKTIEMARYRNLGKTYGPETRKKQSEKAKLRIGEKACNWKGGITTKVRRIRNSDRYAEWRKSVFARDNYTCSVCGDRGVKICAHHIKSFSEHENLRLEISNGETMCKDCHINFHSIKVVQNGRR